MVDDYEDPKVRTKQFALRTIRLVGALPTSLAGRRIGDQLLRSACSVGANYRAACRARSRADFVSKLGIVEEEADESAYWMELIAESDLLTPAKVQALKNEATEIVAIISASRITAKKNGARN